MHLLQLSDSGELRLTTHDGRKLPPYAILSHTWGPDGDEVTFDDVKRRPEEAKSKPGYAKIDFCAQQAKKGDLKHFWIDTCCIDKYNLPELTEAINSMFRWYQQATTCFVYLQDVSFLKRDRTLQELLAPKAVQFWSRDAHYLGTKDDLKDIIHEITGIPIEALLGAPLSRFSAAERLRWAAERETKKPEDKAYCLFGIFDVFLSPIYGEGDNAFARLQTEIEKIRNEQWIFLWKHEDAASRTGHEDIVELLLNAGADVNAFDNNFPLPYALAEASSRGALACAASRGSKLKQHDAIPDGADLNAQADRSWEGNWYTALVVASIHGHGEAVEILVDAGADVNAKSKTGRTPLCEASIEGHEKIVRILIEAGVDVNAKSKTGRIPLCEASERGHEKIVEERLDLGDAGHLAHRRGFWKQFFEASANVSLSGYEEPTDDTVTNTEPTDSFQTPPGHDESTVTGAQMQQQEDDEDFTIESPTQVTGVQTTPKLPPSTSNKTNGDSRANFNNKNAASASYPSPSPRKYTGKNPLAVHDSEEPSTPRMQSAANLQSSPFEPESAFQPSARSRPQNHDPLMHRAILDKNYRIQATPHTQRKQRQQQQATAAKGTPATATKKAPWDDSPQSSPEIAAPQLRSELFSPAKGAPRTPGVSVLTPAARKTGLAAPKTSTGMSLFSPNDKAYTATQERTRASQFFDESDEDDDLAEMSPPKTMQFHIPQSRLVQTPAREASKKIVDDLLLTAGADATDDIEGESEAFDEASPSVIRRAYDVEDDTF
ncbi:DASH complex subunit ask1 [Lecanosticta acicola]|uniref:DASH complex subunit ask1 n=1 Tax=Lecanosticta acicola TaxID=111012 RepID=A0AAI8Z6P9_9PEZI|nr:DASH complex subunit ask1 [Lecanosticta acicola]